MIIFDTIEELKDILDNLDEKFYDDRKEAIETFLSKIDKNSVLLILGKGQEKYQEITPRIY